MQNGKIKVTYDFTIRKPNNLVKLELNTSRAKTLSNPIVKDKLGNNILKLGTKTTANGDNYQIKSSIKAVSADFLVPKVGTYQLTFIEEKFYSASSAYIPTVSVKISEGYMNPYYFNWLLIISLFIMFAGFASRWSFESERWKLAPTEYY